MSQALQIVTDEPRQLAAPATPMTMLAMAVQQGADIDKLEKLMDLQQRFEANEARKAFTAAMAAFKANPPEITKDKLVDFTSQKGTTRYRHATLGNVCSVIVAGLADHGISHRWETEQKGDRVRVTCILTHSQGHSESVSLEASSDNTGNKNSIQQVGSAITYLQRYTLLSVTGLATMETDDDGQAKAPPEQRGKVIDPAAKISRPKESDFAEAPTWQELFPTGWKAWLEAENPENPWQFDNDKVMGMEWKASLNNPALCAWAASYITRHARELDMDYEQIADITNTPATLEDCAPADLWKIAAYIREQKKAGEAVA